MKALFFVAILSLAFSVNAMMTPDLWQERVIKGLSKVATGERQLSAISQTEAQDILYKWFNVKVTCTVPTEKMWLSYCQNMYVGNTALDCEYIALQNPKEKQNIMKNMAVCSIKR